MTKKRYNPLRLKSILTALFCVLMTLPLLAQNRTVRGTVVDEAGETVIGATVIVDGTTRGVLTDFNGTFAIEAAPNENIRISFIGFNDVLVSASTANLNIILREDDHILGELVVIGYGTRRRETLTGAVASTTGAEIRTTRNENVVNMLAGRMPGVRVTQRNAQPGVFDNHIDIRGMGTPLIIVDGIPRDQDYLSRMDANEIENISVLKDASAAIFGVRAANGVLLVTTRRGTGEVEGRFNIEFSTNFGFQTFLYVPRTADAVTHMLLSNEARLQGGGTAAGLAHNWFYMSPPRYSWDQMFEFSSGQRQSTSWTDELFHRVAPQSQHNLSIRGSSNRIDYFFNLGYMEQEGIFRSGSLNYDRWNFRSNVDARITDRLTASVNLSGFQDERNEPHATMWRAFRDAWTFRPYVPAWVDNDRSLGLPAFDGEMIDSQNPVADSDHRISGFRRFQNMNFTGSVALTYNIPGIEGLSARAFYSYNRSVANNTMRRRAYNLYSRRQDGGLDPFQRNAPSNVRREFGTSYHTLMNLSLNYENRFGDHTVSGMILFEEQYRFADGFFAQRNLFFDGDYLFLGDTEGQEGGMASGAIWDEARQAIVGRLGYQFRGRYIIDYAFRYDASSRFPSAKRWGLFQSLSAAWRLCQEDFIQDLIPFLTSMRLRGSIGRMGDDGSASRYPAIFVGYNVSTSRGWIFGDNWMGGVTPTAVPNPFLTWYSANTQNLGLDFNLWNHQLTGGFDLFRRTRSGLLRTPEVMLPMEVGANMPQQNLESDRTFGWEISLGHRNRVGEVSYWISTSVSATKTRWVYRLDSPAGNSMAEWRRVNVSGRNRHIWFSTPEAGRFTSLEQIRNHQVSGGNLSQGSLPGDIFFYDWNGDGVIDDHDHHPIATFDQPTFSFGITGGLTWRDLDMHMNWQGAAGVFSQFDEIFASVGPFGGEAILTKYVDRWRTANVGDNPWHPNTQWIEGHFPATGRPFNSHGSAIRNTSFLRLKALEIGYTLPNAWVQSVGVQSIRVHVGGYNLLTFSGLRYMDPERPGTRGGSLGDTTARLVRNYDHPINRVFNVGARLTF